MKKVMATVLCFVMATTILSSCASGTGNSSEPAAETTKSTEEEVTTAPTEEPAGDPAGEPAAQAEIIPLWNTTFVDGYGTTIDQILSDTPPADLFNTDFVSGIGRYWPWATTELKVNDNKLYLLDTYTSVGAPDFVLCNPSAENSDQNVAVFFISAEDSTATYLDAYGSTATLQFLPLYYNTGKKCLAGYWVNAGATTFVECYWNAENSDYFCIEPEDTSIYGV